MLFTLFIVIIEANHWKVAKVWWELNYRKWSCSYDKTILKLLFSLCLGVSTVWWFNFWLEYEPKKVESCDTKHISPVFWWNACCWAVIDIFYSALLLKVIALKKKALKIFVGSWCFFFNGMSTLQLHSKWGQHCVWCPQFCDAFSVHHCSAHQNTTQRWTIHNGNNGNHLNQF